MVISWENKHTYIKQMKKYIYKITNIQNNKCYIGQTKNYEKRWKEHKYLLNKNKHENIYLQYAWNKYGENNFIFEVIEFVNNYNERERYWISFYNSTDHNFGYNFLKGGENPPVGSHRTLTDQEVLDIQRILMNGQSIQEVVSKFPQVSESQIVRINNGTAWHNENLTYPLTRPNPNTFTNQEVSYIIEDLQQGDLSQKQIAQKYHCSRSAITAINNGQNFRRDNIQYPIRSTRICKLTTTDINQIVDLLKNTSYSFQTIADMFHISFACIYDINRGKRHYNDELNEYPIRK